MEPGIQTLLGRLEDTLGRRYLWFCALFATVLVLLLALAAHADGTNRPRAGAIVWALGLYPAMSVYTLLVHPLLRRRWQQAMHSLRALAPRAVDSGRHSRVGRHGEWVAMLLGSVLGIALAHDLPAADGWLRLYGQTTSALMFALLVAVIFGGLARTRQLAVVVRGGLALEVFDGHLLRPFARWGQRLSLAFVGGICLSLVFQSAQSLRSLVSVVIYGSLVVVSLVVFFVSVWTIHVALAQAQEKELARVRRDLAAAREALHRYWEGAPAGALHEPYLAVVLCGIYEKQVQDASTWPFDPAIVRQLLASAVAPLSLYLLKLAGGINAGL